MLPEAHRDNTFLCHHETGMSIDPHLADLLVPYMALVEGTSVLTTSRITSHLETNLLIIYSVLDIVTKVSEKRADPGTLWIMPAVLRQ